MDLAKKMEELDAKKEALSAETIQVSEQRKKLEALRQEKLELTKNQNGPLTCSTNFGVPMKRRYRSTKAKPRRLLQL